MIFEKIRCSVLERRITQAYRHTSMLAKTDTQTHRHTDIQTHVTKYVSPCSSITQQR